MLIRCDLNPVFDIASNKSCCHGRRLQRCRGFISAINILISLSINSYLMIIDTSHQHHPRGAQRPNIDLTWGFHVNETENVCFPWTGCQYIATNISTRFDIYFWQLRWSEAQRERLPRQWTTELVLVIKHLLATPSCNSPAFNGQS